MTKQKPLILVTNDDGFQAKGIKSLINSIRELGEIVVVAPDGPRSGMSAAITSLHPLRVFLHSEEKNLKTYVCSGTPVDCIKLAMNEIVDRKPDLIVTGINHGANSAISVLYSGTMGAAMEGCIFDVPSIGFSLQSHSTNADFSLAGEVARLLSETVLNEGLPSGTCLNVNIPSGHKIAGIRICRQAPGKWTEEIQKATDGANQEIYWLSGYFLHEDKSDETTDEWALTNGYVSVVPVKTDLTDYDYIKSIKKWENTPLLLKSAEE